MPDMGIPVVASRTTPLIDPCEIAGFVDCVVCGKVCANEHAAQDIRTQKNFTIAQMTIFGWGLVTIG